ncbi:uncharacterized protein LOC117106037 isoform X1 [Anneissia japonica]|uniref:uncharacterized protein LOC117106037 isoform X1 n=1 Tax=Anneissia japonica TaxID=1529436 RepID=UPI0014256399|nr:uncharacterized protein LOC117106037 isoform X1 [Anneissia japonica]
MEMQPISIEKRHARRFPYNSAIRMKQSEEEFSCHLTWKELKHIEINNFKTKIQLLSERNVSFDQLPTYYLSIKNLLAFVLYTAGQTDDSIRVLEEVLRHDPGNYNAISNLAVIYFRQSKVNKYKEYRDALKRIMQINNTNSKIRAMVDKAHAIRHFEQDERNFTYMDILVRVGELAESTSTPERAEWFFDYALALFRKDAQLTSTGAKSSETHMCFKNAVSYFNKVIHITNGSLTYKALSWIFISILLRHEKGRALTDILADDDDMRYMSACDCLEQALKVNPFDRVVQRRAGSEHIRMKRYSEALCLLDDSLKQEESWFAYRYRGLLRLEIYEDNEYAPQYVNKKELLLAAKSDFECAIILKEVHADHSDLGYIHYLLGDYNTAINHFVAAVSCTQNDNFDPSITHYRWAECLRAIGEPEGALQQLQSQKQTRDQLNRNNLTLEAAFLSSDHEQCNGVDCNISQFKYCQNYVPGYVNILSDISLPSPPVSCQNKAINKKYKYDFYVSFCHADYKWSLELIRKLEKELNFRGCVRHRDYVAGDYMAHDISDAIHNSNRIIMVVTPDAVSDKWWKYELKRAVAESVTRGCLVPIVLRQSPIPKEIGHLTSIRLFKSQFLREDWSRLEKFLKS